jgi:hypothetical protein
MAELRAGGNIADDNNVHGPVCMTCENGLFRLAEFC